MKIKLTSVYVDDQSKALSFYTDVLGLTKINYNSCTFNDGLPVVCGADHGCRVNADDVPLLVCLVLPGVCHGPR